MKNKPVFQSKICLMCGKDYTPNGPSQKYCHSCIDIADKERKRKSYIKYHPNAYAPPKEKEFCVVCGEPMSCHFDGKPYCNKHWQRMYNNGTTELKSYRTKNKYYIFDNVSVGLTSRGDFYKIDTEDLERCKQHTWVKDNRGYFVSRINHKTVTLHRFLLNLTDGTNHVDHINGKKEDNTKSNLRTCTSNQNTKNLKRKSNNTSGYPGVDKYNGKWRARITVNRKDITIGVYKTFNEALVARQDAEIKYFGKFAPCLCRTNLLT